MPVQTKAPPTPRTTFMWEVEIEGPNGLLDTALVQTLKIPKVELSQAEISQGGQNYNVAIATGISFDTLEIKKLMPSDTTDGYAWDWVKACVDPITGSIGRARNYKFRVSVHLLDEEMERIETYIYDGCAIKSVNIGEQDARNKDVMIEELVFSVDRRIQ